MLNLKVHSTIIDQIAIAYEGPGYYSGKAGKILQDELFLEKVSEEYIDKEDVYNFCKLEGYKVKPYPIRSMSDIPSNWEIVNRVNELDVEDNY